MKNYLVFISLFVFASCSHHAKTTNQVERKVASYEVLDIGGIEEKIKLLVKQENYLSDSKKESLEKLLLKSVKENEKLKAKESRLAQHFIEESLKQESTYESIRFVKKEMLKNYEAKANLFDSTYKQVKTLLDKNRKRINSTQSVGSLFK